MAKTKVTKKTESERSWIWTLVKGGIAFTFALSIAFNITNTMHLSMLERAVAVAEKEEGRDDVYVYVIREEAEDAQDVVDFTQVEPIIVIEKEDAETLTGDGVEGASGADYDSIPLWPGKWIKVNKRSRDD